MSRSVLDLVQKRLGDLVGDNWAERQEEHGEKVKLWREYYDGDHRGDMTPEMRAMLRLDNRTDDFNANFCEMVVDSLTDRLRVSSIDAVVPEPDDVIDGEVAGDAPAEMADDPQKKAQKWVDNLLEVNRFDGLMLDVHDAVPKDADTFVMVEYDNKLKSAKMAFEPAYDGDFGMIPVYDRMKKNVEAAVKIWWEMGYQYVNIYLPDHIERYRAVMADKEDAAVGNMQPMKAQEMRLELREAPAGVNVNEDGHLAWVDDSSTPLGVPVVPFSWKKSARKENGTSELKKVIPLNDALNRNMYSMVMTGELSAFSILMSKGFEIPAGLAPGKSITITLAEVVKVLGGQVTDASAMASLMSSLDIKRLEPGQLSPFIEQATFLIDLIAMVSRTPVRTLMGGSTQSGESLKQRESGLIGKVKNAHIRLGNSWEDVVMMAHKLETVFATKKPPEILRFACRWDDPEVRNDAEYVKTVTDMADYVSQKEVRRSLAPVREWDEKRLQMIEDEIAKEKSQSTGLPNQIEDYSNLVVPSVQPDAQPVEPLAVAVGQG